MWIVRCADQLTIHLAETPWGHIMLSQPEGTGLIIAKQWVFHGYTIVVFHSDTMVITYSLYINPRGYGR
jgi:hypothetical protein